MPTRMAPLTQSVRVPLEAFQGLQDLGLFRKSHRLLLGEERFPVGRHLENAVAPRDQFDGALELLLDRRRQPGGLGEVVSDSAICNRDLHRDSLP